MRTRVTVIWSLPRGVDKTLVHTSVIMSTNLFLIYSPLKITESDNRPEDLSPLMSKHTSGHNSEPVHRVTTSFPDVHFSISLHLLLDLLNCRFPEGFRTKIVFSFLVSPIRSTYSFCNFRENNKCVNSAISPHITLQ
jgi:hypothetical protein